MEAESLSVPLLLHCAAPPTHTLTATSRSGASRNREESPVIGYMWGYWLALAMPDVDQFWFFKLGCDSGTCVAQGQALAPCPALTQ